MLRLGESHEFCMQWETVCSLQGIMSTRVHALIHSRMLACHSYTCHCGMSATDLCKVWSFSS